MSHQHNSLITAQPLLLPFRGTQALVVQAVLLASAVVLPIIAHLLHAPVRMLLPMHWPVMLAGMVYGWRSGAITGALAPLLSFLLSGYPLPNILPSMTAELFVYGFVSGLLRQRYIINSFISITASIIAGRIVFVLLVLISHRAAIGEIEYFSAALLPGIIPACLQIVTLPFVAQWIIKRKYSKDNTE
ncbi:MAG: ECF transporter S component [Bacteroidota bacterium]